MNLLTKLINAAALIGAVLRRIGLSGLSRKARKLVARISGENLRVESPEGLILVGSVAHRGYLNKIRLGTVEKRFTDEFRKAVRPGSTVLDVGSFLGWYSLIAAQIVGETGTVHSIEPNPTSFGLVVRNIQLNSFGNIVETHHLAAADGPGKIRFNIHEQPSESSAAFAATHSGQLVEVMSDSLDTHLGALTDLSVIKIDVEGYEPYVIRGLQQNIRNAPPGLKLLSEVYPLALERAGSNRDEYLSLLRSLGFTLSVIDEKSDRVKPIEESSIGDGVFNVLASRD